MTQIAIGNIILNVDVQSTVDYYMDKPTFICNCNDCQNYLGQLKSIINEFKGLDKELGIDLTKDVGIGSDELMPHHYEDHLLYVVPYYVIGNILPTKASSYALNNRINLRFQTYKYNAKMHIKEDAFCMWLEIRLPLLNK